jgi:hypothetical protein
LLQACCIDLLYALVVTVRTDMMNDQDAVSRTNAPNWTQSGATPQGASAQWTKPSPIDAFLGGSPVSVFLKLIFVSMVVGALMMWLGLRPVDLVQGLTRLAQHLWALGFDAIRDVADYVIAGAMIVVPVWLILRILNLRSQALRHR